MLKKDTLKMFKDLGINTDKLIAAIKDENEVDFEMPAINNLSDEQLTERDKNTIATAKPDIFKEGKNAGIEIANKAITKKYGIEADVKDVDKVIAALDAKVSTGDAGLKQQIEALQRDKGTLETQLAEKDKQHKDILFDSELLSSMPANRAAAGMSDREFLALTKMNLQFEETDGKMVVKKDGVVLTDTKTRAPLPLKDAINTLFTEKKWISAQAQGGRGGNDNPGGGSAGLKKFSQVQEQWQKDNPGGNVISPEFQTHVAAAAKSTDGFDWDN